jgi:hypothetical protein
MPRQGMHFIDHAKEGIGTGQPVVLWRAMRCGRQAKSHCHYLAVSTDVKVSCPYNPPGADKAYAVLFVLRDDHTGARSRMHVHQRLIICQVASAPLAFGGRPALALNTHNAWKLHIKLIASVIKVLCGTLL